MAQVMNKIEAERNAILQPSVRYASTMIVLHWATAVLIIAAFASIEIRVLFEKGTPIRTGVKELHYVIGTLILAITLLRIGIRIFSRSKMPPILPQPPLWQLTAAKAMHFTLYGALVALPVMGLLTVSALGDRMPVAFGLEIPPLMSPDKEFGKWLEDQHSLLGSALYFLIGFHAMAALFHHYVMRDNTLARMAPKRQ